MTKEVAMSFQIRRADRMGSFLGGIHDRAKQPNYSQEGITECKKIPAEKDREFDEVSPPFS